MSKPVQNRPKKDQWDAKRILSTIFIVCISGLLILLFIGGDAMMSCEGGASHGLLARIDGRPVYYDNLRNELAVLQNENRESGGELDHETLIDQALDRYLMRNVLLWAAQKSGIRLADETRREILHRWLRQTQTTPAQFSAASKSYRREVERHINEAHMCETLQADIFSAPNTTTLALSIENEIKSILVSVDMVYLDVRQTVSEKTPSQEELQNYFASAAQAEGPESWRRAQSFESLTWAEREELVNSWRNDTFAMSYLGAFQEAEEKMKVLEEKLAEGQDIAAAAREAGVPLYASAPFGWGENPQAGGREFPVTGEFSRQALALQPGNTSEVLKMPADFPQVLTLFRVRTRRALPNNDAHIFANKAELAKLPPQQQEELSGRMRALAEQYMQNARFALVQEVFDSFYKSARVTRTPLSREGLTR